MLNAMAAAAAEDDNSSKVERLVSDATLPWQAVAPEEEFNFAEDVIGIDALGTCVVMGHTIFVPRTECTLLRVPSFRIRTTEVQGVVFPRAEIRTLSSTACHELPLPAPNACNLLLHEDWYDDAYEHYLIVHPRTGAVTPVALADRPTLAPDGVSRWRMSRDATKPASEDQAKNARHKLGFNSLLPAPILALNLPACYKPCCTVRLLLVDEWEVIAVPVYRVLFGTWSKKGLRERRMLAFATCCIPQSSNSGGGV